LPGVVRCVFWGDQWGAHRGSAGKKGRGGILTKLEPKLTKAQEIKVKKIARKLLTKLKRERN
jgi:hypothetical protein